MGTGSPHRSHGKSQGGTGVWGICAHWLCGRCSMLWRVTRNMVIEKVVVDVDVDVEVEVEVEDGQ